MAKTATRARAPKAAASNIPTLSEALMSRNAQLLGDPLPREFRKVELISIHPGGANTRSAITAASVRELADSMAVQGLLQPIIVAPNDSSDAEGDYTILAGRRRLAAAQLLGWQLIDACVLDGGAARALEVLIVENDQRVGPDPMIESEVVAEMLNREGWGYRDVAAALGKSVGWVVRRSSLRKLSKGARAIIDRERKFDANAWSLSDLEELSLLSPDQQEEVAREAQYFGPNQLAREVRARMGTLAGVPWALEDAESFPGLGSCSTCTKHTAAVPSLFPEEKSLAKLKGALCLDGGCYAAKRTIHVQLAVIATAKVHAGTIVRADPLEEDVSGHGALKAFAKETGAKYVDVPNSQFPYVPAKEGAKGAVPVVQASGARAGEVEWMKPASKNGASHKPGPGRGEPPRREAAKPMSMNEKKKALEYKRHRAVFQEFRAEIEELSKADAKCKALAAEISDTQVLQLVAAFGAPEQERFAFNYKAGTRAAQIGGGAEAVRARVLKGVLEHSLRARGAFSAYYGNGDGAPDAAASVGTFLAAVPIGADIGARRKNAEYAHPVPKSWAGEAGVDKLKAKVKIIRKGLKDQLRSKKKRAVRK